MGDDNRIDVERGAKLEVIDGTITNACPGKPWRGIFVHGNATEVQPNPDANPGDDLNIFDSGIVRLRRCTLEYADAAIRTDVFAPPYHGYRVERWGGLIDAEDCVFANNRVGVGFMKYEIENTSKFVNCVFEETDDQIFPVNSSFGVTIWGCKDIVFEKTIFRDLDRTGIHSENSGFFVENQCQFLDMQIGIRATSSTLLNPRIWIRGINNDGIASDEFRNIFGGNNIHIQFRGLGNISTRIVTNNKFSGGNYGVQASLFSTTTVSRNFFSATKVSVNFNNNYHAYVGASCNLFKGGCIGVLVRGENRGIAGGGFETGLRFDGNDYSQFQGIGLKLTNLAGTFGDIPNIGTFGLFNSAENCFTDDILAEIVTSGNTNNFIYRYSTLDPCYKVEYRFNIPNNDNMFLTLSGPGSDMRCEQDETILASPSALQQVRDSLHYYGNQLNNDPNNEQYQAYYNYHFNQKENLLRDLLELLLKDNEYTQAENLLLEESNERQLKWGYSIKLSAKDYAGAQAKLNQLNTSDLENLNFVKTQEIVLAVETTTTEFTLNPQQISELTLIANGLGKSSGHAMTLLERYSQNYEAPLFDQCLTTDCDCDAKLQDETDATPKSNLEDQYKIYPNPASEILNIEFNSNNDDLKTIRIFSIAGKLISTIPIDKSGIKSVDIRAYPPGIYLLNIEENGKTIFQDKFSIIKY